MNVKSSEAISSNQTGSCSFVSRCAMQPMREKAELYEAAEWPQLPILELHRCPEWRIPITQPFHGKHVTSSKAIVTDPGNLKDYSDSESLSPTTRQAFPESPAVGKRIPPLQEDVHTLIPRILHDKRDFADAIKLQILRWGDCLDGMSEKRKWEGQSLGRRWDNGSRGHCEGAVRERIQVASRSWKRQGNGFSSEHRGPQPCQHLDFSPVRPASDF